jgi:two-component system CheB/CheR fusion protein
LEAKARLFRRLETGLQPEPVEFPASFASTGQGAGKTAPRAPKQRPNVGTLTERILLQHHTPAAVLVNPKGDIVYISGKTGAYLEPAAGKANWNVLAMAREGLRYELTGAFSMAVKEGKTVKLRGVQSGTGGSPQAVDVTVQPLDEPEALRGMVLVAFADAPAAPAPKAPGKGGRGSARDGRSARLERELESARDEVKTTREAMQTAQEELRSANEELQSTNEELQSTNEELTTSKEELQSLNEELQTVNQELQAKVDELSGTNNDMRNLLNSTDIATLFLDGSLLVRRFTTQAAQIFKLIPGDVGRPITDVASSLVYPDLAYDSQEVLRTLVLVEKPVAARGGRWFKVRIMPYRTLDNRIDGVVITFTNITASRTLETQLREKNDQLIKDTMKPGAESKRVKTPDSKPKKRAAGAKTTQPG